MKFRGRMVELMAIKKFYNILGTMAKLSKVCVLRITSDKLFFILTETNKASNGLKGANQMTMGPSVWCEMEQNHFFHEYNMEGVTAEQPEIYLELEPDRLVKTLNTLKSNNTVKSFKIKLTRKHSQPCLSFEVEAAGAMFNASMLNGNPQSMSTMSAPSNRLCVHDVPVIIIPRRLWKDFQEPEMQAFDLSIYLPELKQLKHLVEKYKNLGSFVTIQANVQGSLKFSLETDQVKVVTHFKGLNIPEFDETWLNRTHKSSIRSEELMNNSIRNQQSVNEDREEDRVVSVRVDLKRFNLILSAEQINPRNIVANLVENRMVHLFIIHDDVCIQYFIPAINEG